MPYYRRNYVEGGTYFFTVVAGRRRPILTTESSRKILCKAIEEELDFAPFEQFAFVLLPDHFHTIWMLPPGDDDYSMRMKRIKERFTRDYLAAGGEEATRSRRKLNKGERGVWQPRFWEHTVWDEHDLSRCLDYIHWNPVKHGFVSKPCEYPWSTFRKFVRLGEYTPDWGTGIAIPDVPGAEWE